MKTLEITKHVLLYVLFVVCATLFFAVLFASAQTNSPSGGATQAQIDAALADLSEIYGSPIVRVDQARAICDDEQYVLACVEIGKRHNLFDSEREAQVDVIVEEIKGSVLDELGKCEDIDCLVSVANTLAKQLSAKNPDVAIAVDLTTEKVEEKRIIAETAKEIGVDFEQCRTMDPDTASVDLLRACARLAQDVRIQNYIPEEYRGEAIKVDATIALKERLASGEVQCGDGTLEGCGSFCLNPPADATERGVSAIPPICREIAERFFGPQGIGELESAYTHVQQTFDGLSRPDFVNPEFLCPIASPLPCPVGEYRQESKNALGCRAFGSCIPISTNTSKEETEIGRAICPALPTVISCGVGQEKFAEFTSPECGTYYGCRDVRIIEGGITFPYSFSNGKRVGSLSEARAYCNQNPPGSGQGVAGECEAKIGVVYPKIDPKTAYGSCDKYGFGWHPADKSGNCFSPDNKEYRTPGGTLQQCKNVRVFGCIESTYVPYEGDNWVQHTWKFTDGSVTSSILDRTDSEYLKFISGIEAQCSKISKSKFAWKSGAGDDSGANWQSFGIPDCSGNASPDNPNQYQEQYPTYGDCTSNASKSSCTAQAGCRWNEINETGDPAAFYANGYCSGDDYITPTEMDKTAAAGSPFAPKLLTATVVDTDVELRWDNTANAEWSVTKLKVWRKAPSGSWSALVEIPTYDKYIPFPTYTDTSAPQSGFITYQVQTCNDKGCSVDSNQAIAAVVAPECSDNKDNDDDGWVDYPSDNGCESREDDNETYEYKAPPAAVNDYEGDANSCPGFAYSRWDSTGKRFCQLNTEASCNYGYPSYLTADNYTKDQCPAGQVTTSSNTTGTCSSELFSLLGSGCHSMGNAWFNGSMTQYVMPGTNKVQLCATGWISGCSSDGGTSSTSYTSSTTDDYSFGSSGENWVNKTWRFADGTTQYSSILSRTDSEYTTFIDGVYASCQGKYFAGWKSGAGDQSNWNEFGVPSCSSTQPSAGSTTYTPSTGGTSSTGSTSGSMQRCYYPNATIDGTPPGYTVWCEADYYNCRQGDPNGATVSTTGLSLGAPSACESGWSSGSTGGSCSSYTSQSSCTGAGGCGWNTVSNYCFTDSDGDGSGDNSDYGYCSNYADQSSCTGVTNCYWESSSNYCYYDSGSGGAYGDCTYNGSESSCTAQAGCSWYGSYCQGDNYTSSSTSCPSGQYWNGSACASSSDACTQAGGTWDSASNYCNMPTSYFCPSGLEWVGSHCIYAQGTHSESNVASAIRAFLSIFGL